MTGYVVSFLVSYTGIAIYALYLLDRSHQRTINRLCELYERQIELMQRGNNGPAL